MPQNANFIHFAIVTVTICIPSYLFIFSLNSDAWQERYKAMFHCIRHFIAHPLSRHRSASERPRNWWSRFWEPEPEHPVQKRRQSRSTTAFEDLEKWALPVEHRETQRPAFPQSITLGSRENGVRFDCSSFNSRPRLERQEKNSSDLGPLSTLQEEEDLSPMSEPRGGVFKSIAERISGQSSPNSAV